MLKRRSVCSLIYQSFCYGIKIITSIWKLCWVCWKIFLFSIIKKRSWMMEQKERKKKMIIIITNICFVFFRAFACSVPVILFNVNGVFTLFVLCFWLAKLMSIISYEKWKWCFKYQHTLYLLFLSANFTCLDIQILFKFWIGFTLLCFFFGTQCYI